MKENKKSSEELIKHRKKEAQRVLRLKNENVFERDLNERIAMANKINDQKAQETAIKLAKEDYALNMASCKRAEMFLEKFSSVFA